MNAMLLGGLLLVGGCDAMPPEDAGDVVVQARFEQEADLEGWQRHGALHLQRDAPPGGGEWAAFVAGGCIHPHATQTFTADADGQLRIAAWARNLTFGGGLTLGNWRSGDRVHVSVRDSTWSYLHATRRWQCRPATPSSYR